MAPPSRPRFSWEPGAGLHDGRRMKTPTLLLALLAPLMGAWPLAAPATGLVPFEARYEAFHKGAAAGQATMRVAPTAGARWRIDLDVHGEKGLAGLAGLDVAQSTVFDLAGEEYRPVSQSTVRKAFFMGRKSVGTYDWTSGTARWTGDIKAARRKPVALQAGDMSGLLINLAILRDAEPGRHLRYRYVDGGRVRPHEYVVSAVPERITVGDLVYEALRVSRANGGEDETIVWVADGVPTPVRILQREDGQDAIDLRLTSYKGVQ